METTTISKFLSLVLRHEPQRINIVLDENGWTDVDTLIQQCNNNGMPIDFDLLEEVVVTNDKQRFVFNDDYSLIRASQGHSVKIDLALDASVPPEFLFHGTVFKFMDAIKNNGLQKMSRQYVHLSKDTETAITVGSRRGKPVILKIASGQMAADKYLFCLSENGVWLTDHVPSQYIIFPE